MKTETKQDELINQIKQLSELELESLISELVCHLSNNNMEHIILNNIQPILESHVSCIVDDLEYEIIVLQHEIIVLQEELFDLKKAGKI